MFSCTHEFFACNLPKIEQSAKPQKEVLLPESDKYFTSGGQNDNRGDQTEGREQHIFTQDLNFRTLTF